MWMSLHVIGFELNANVIKSGATSNPEGVCTTFHNN